MLVFALGLVVGNAVVIPGWSPDLVSQGFSIFIICTILTIMLSTPVAIFASIGRGYLSPLGFVVFTLVLAQIVAATGYGQFFPWSIPAMASGVAGIESAILQNYSVVIVLITSIVGLFSTMLWWRYSDQN
jgi:ABC-2 type transport system permease protein